MSHSHNGHSCSHAHHHHSGESNLIITICLNVVITIAEFAGGLLSGSLALLSDAFHNLSDVITLIVSYIAIMVGKKEKDHERTYGYKRAEIIAAFVNVLVLFLVCGYIVFEAVHRLTHPSPINVKLMFIIAVIGFAANGLSVLMLFRDAKKNINIKSAFLHLLADTLSSVAVITTAVILIYKPWYWLDALMSILITIYIAKESLSLLFESVHILMQGSPKNIDREQVKQRILKSDNFDIEDVHHIHMWEVSPGNVVFDAHIVVKKENLAESDVILCAIKSILSKEYGIHHSTLQLESLNQGQCSVCEI